MRARLAALGVSFLVLAIPVVGPHAAFLVGEYLWRSVVRGRSGPQLWLAALATLVAQGVVLVVGLLLVRRPLWLRGLAAALTLAAATVALNIAILVAIPTATMIEHDPRPDVGELSEACRFAGYDMPYPPSTRLAEAGRAVLRPVAPAAATLALLHLPECVLEPTALPADTAQLSMRPSGAALFAVMRRADASYEWFVAPAGASAPRAVSLGDWNGRDGGPVLVDEGRHAAWLAARRSERGYAVREPPWADLVTFDLATGEERRTTVSGLDRGHWRLLDAPGADGPFLVVRDGDREYARLDASGHALAERPRQPGPEYAQMLSDVLLLEGGWLGWDVYAEERRYVVAWDLPAGRGRVDEPKGRGITSAAADPAGRFVAYSTTPTLNVGRVRDAVVLLDATDGRELFRRSLPSYARAQVALVGGGFFAWSDAREAPGFVRVHPLPAPESR